MAHPPSLPPPESPDPQDFQFLEAEDAVQPLDQAALDAFEQFPDPPPPPSPWPGRMVGLLLLGLSLGGWRMWQGHWDPRCDRAYAPCIPSPPPVLTCDQVPVQNFRVYGPHHHDKPWGLRQFDPHGFDPDEDGYGCESGGPLAHRRIPTLNE